MENEGTEKILPEKHLPPVHKLPETKKIIEKLIREFVKDRKSVV